MKDVRLISRRPMLATMLASPALFSGCTKSLEPSRPKHAGLHDVVDYGALGDGRTKATDAIRAAIAAASAEGGGTVYFPPGQFLTGPIHLKSNITLEIDSGAVVKFSDDFADYLPMVRSRWEGTEVINFSPLFYADGVENVAIRGRGVLDGQGKAWWDFFRPLKEAQKQHGQAPTSSKWQQEFLRLNAELELPDDPARLKLAFLRPPFIQFLNSQNILIEGVTLKDSPFWTVNPVYCDNLTVSRITIRNPEDGPNTDGINPESCRNVRISDCHIDVGDDCITIKSGRDAEARRINRAAENYTISNCTMLKGHGGVVIGSEMSGGVRNIAISNCIFEGTERGIRLKSTRGRGGVVENVRVTNVIMKQIRLQAIVLDLMYTETKAEPVSERTPRFRGIHVSGITGDAKEAAFLQGLAEAPLEDVRISDVSLTAETGVRVLDVRDIELRAVRVDTASGPAISVERGENLQLLDASSRRPHAETPVIELRDVKNAYVHGCFAAPGTDVFLAVEGASSEKIVVDDNNLLNARQAIRTGSDLKPSALVARPEAGGALLRMEDGKT